MLKNLKINYKLLILLEEKNDPFLYVIDFAEINL